MDGSPGNHKREAPRWLTLLRVVIVRGAGAQTEVTKSSNRFQSGSSVTGTWESLGLIRMSGLGVVTIRRNLWLGWWPGLEGGMNTDLVGDNHRDSLPQV